MFLIKIFHFLKGYVILSVWGKNKEKFLTALCAVGIKPINIMPRKDKILFTVSIADFFRIRSQDVRARIHIEQKHGLAFLLKKLKKRKAFVFGLIVFLLIFIIGSQFVWTVEFEGVKNCDIKRLKEATKQAGIKEGMLKKNLKEPLYVKDIILANTDDLVWAFMYVEGTRVTIAVRENIIPPEVFAPNVPCDIVAARQGIIKRVITKHGVCVAEENQAVSPGDTIISGTYIFENEPGYQVHASGIVEAYTEHTKSGTYKQSYCYKKYTGRVRNLLIFKFLKWDVPLYISDKIDFECFDTYTKNYDLKFGKNNYIGIGLKNIICKEFIEKKEPLPYDTVVEMAKRELSEEIAKELLPGADLVDEKIDAQAIDEETVSVKLTMKFIEKIGTEKRIEEVTVVEPKTDRDTGGN